MGRSERIGKKVAQNLEDDGEHAITASKAQKQVKNTGDIDSPWKDHIAAGFRKAGWTTSNGLYYLPEKLSEETVKVSQELRAEGRPVVSQSVVSQEVTGKDYPRGKWGDRINEAIEDEGWETDDENGLYFLPMDELVTESSLAHYVFGSFQLGETKAD